MCSKLKCNNYSYIAIDAILEYLHVAAILINTNTIVATTLVCVAGNSNNGCELESSGTIYSHTIAK